MATLPEGWIRAYIGQIAEICYGSSLPERERISEGGVPVFASSGLVGYHNQALHPGPSIIIGRKGTVGTVYNTPGPFWAIDTAFYLDKIDQDIDIHYLTYALLHSNLARLSITVGVPGISRKDIEMQLITLPPLPEQKRIASILQEADRLLSLRRQATIQVAELLPSLFIEMFGYPSEWQKPNRLEECGTFFGGGTPSRKVARYFEGSIPWATSKDVKSRYLYNAQEHITEEAIKASATNLVPERSILIVVKSKILAHSLPISIILRPFCFGQDLKGLVCHQKYQPEFIVSSILAQEDEILQRARGVNTEGLTLDMLRSIKIPRVDPDRQQDFVRQVTEYNLIEVANNTAQRSHEKLFDSLLSQAFNGELTETWRGQYRAELAVAASARDQRLAQVGRRAVSHGVISAADIESISQMNKWENTFAAYLSAEQQAVWVAAQATEGYFNADGLIQGAGVSAVTTRQTLDLLAAAGLVLPVSLYDNATGAYVPAYRTLRPGTEDRRGDESRADDLTWLRTN